MVAGWGAGALGEEKGGDVEWAGLGRFCGCVSCVCLGDGAVERGCGWDYVQPSHPLDADEGCGRYRSFVAWFPSLRLHAFLPRLFFSARRLNRLGGWFGNSAFCSSSFSFPFLPLPSPLFPNKKRRFYLILAIIRSGELGLDLDGIWQAHRVG